MFSASCPHHSDSLCFCNSESLRHESELLLSNATMRCIGEIRRLRLIELLSAYTQADLNRLRGKQDRDSTLSQYVRQAPESTTGKPRQLGDSVARELERVTGKPLGWMDRDPLVDDLEARLAAKDELQRAGPIKPSIEEALPVVLDAIAASPARAELRLIFPLLVDTDATAYRKRLAELLSVAELAQKDAAAA